MAKPETSHATESAPTLSPTEIAVVRIGDAWSVIGCLGRWGRHAFRVDAEEAALRLAAQEARAGHAVTVLVQGVDGELRRL